MNLIRLIVFFLVVTTIKGISQEIDIRGEIYDASTGVALADVHVRLVNAPIGTITNLDGRFQLTLDENVLKDSVSFSIVGYKTQKKPLTEFRSSESLIIKLELETYVLKEIIIKAPNVKEIMDKVVNNIKINYPIQPYTMEAYFKCVQQIDNKFVSFFDAAVKIQDPGYQSPKLYNEKIEVLRKRNSNHYNNKGFENWIDNQSYGHIGFLLVENYVKYKRGMLEKSNKYEYDSTINYGDKLLHVIKCIAKPYYLAKRKEDENYKLTARLYIDSETYAIIRIDEEESYSSQDNNLGPFAWVRETNDSIKSVLTSVHKKIEFREFNGKYYLSHISGHYIVKDYNSKIKSFIHTNIFKRELLVNMVYNNTLEEAATKGQDRIKLVTGKYDSQFWRNYNIVQPSSLDKIVFRELSLLKPIEEQFEENSQNN